jgi:hypothetical protein
MDIMIYSALVRKIMVRLKPASIDYGSGCSAAIRLPVAKAEIGPGTYTLRKKVIMYW